MADKVLGSTSEKGLGGLGKRSSGSYTGGGIRLNVTGVSAPQIAGGTGRVSAGAGAGINVPLVQARQIKPLIEETPKAQGPALSGDTVANGMNHIATSVEKYVDDMNTLKARAASVEFNNALFDMFHGNEEKGIDGFRHTEGFAATEGYGGFQQSVNEAMKKALDALDPAARQKAVMTMFAARDSYLNKGSQHVVAQKSALQEFTRQEERILIQKEFTAYPPDALSAEQVDDEGNKYTVGSQLKARWIASYPPEQVQRALSDWENLVLDTAKGLYYEGQGRMTKSGNYIPGDGLTALNVFRNTVGKEHLSTNKFRKLNDFITTAESQEIRMANAAEAAFEKAHDKLIKRTQVTNFSKLVDSVLDPNKSPIPLTEANALMGSNGITSSQFNTYTRLLNRQQQVTDTGVYDYVLANSLHEKIVKSASSSTLLDGSESLIEEIASSNLARPLLNKLTSELNSQLTKAHSEQRSSMKEYISTLIPKTYRAPTEAEIEANPDLIMKGISIRTDEEARMEYEAYEMYLDLRSGESPLSHAEAKAKVTQTYSVSDRILELKPTIGRYGKPRNIGMWENIGTQLESDLATGKISKEEHDSLIPLFLEYKTFFDQKAAQNATTF